MNGNPDSESSDDKTVISAYIITKNEEQNITRAIRSVRWMDEVIVLDSGSSDSTLDKARKLGARIAEAEFKGFADQKNKAMNLCHGEWVFNLDADEEVTPELRKSIEEVILNGQHPDKPQVYCVTRKTYYLGRWIKHCGWYPEYRSRLSVSGQARWTGDVLHEKLCGDGPVGHLSGDLLHRPYTDLGEHLRTIDRYSELWTKREVNSGRRICFFDILLRPAAKFLKMYVIRAGFLDFGSGLIASLMGAWYTFMKYARLYEALRIQKWKN